MQKCAGTYFWALLQTSNINQKYKVNIPEKYCMFTFVCNCVLCSWPDFYSETREHNGQSRLCAVCSVCFSMLKQETWSQIFTSLNQPVHLRSKGGQMSFFGVYGNFDLALHNINVCIYAWNKVKRVSFLRFIFTLFFFLCIFVCLCLRNCYLCFNFFAQFTKGVEYSWIKQEV